MLPQNSSNEQSRFLLEVNGSCAPHDRSPQSDLVDLGRASPLFKTGCDPVMLHLHSLRAAKDLHMLVIAFLAAFSLLPQLSLAQESALEKRGEELLQTECARCHAIGRTGTSPNSEAPPFRQLSRKYQIDTLAEALAEGLSVGHAEMPEFVFDADEVAAIIAFLKSIQER
jgi:mono/diheme cytochrome c family protein